MVPAAMESLVRDGSFVASYPHRAGNPRSWLGVTWVHKVG